MAIIDVKRLAAEVSVQHGIRLDPDDPIMAVVALNQLVFEQAVNEVLERMATATREFENAADKVQARAGGILAQEVRECVTTLRMETLRDASAFTGPRQANPGGPNAPAKIVYAQSWIVRSVLIAVISFSCGVWLGTWLR